MALHCFERELNVLVMTCICIYHMTLLSFIHCVQVSLLGFSSPYVKDNFQVLMICLYQVAWEDLRAESFFLLFCVNIFYMYRV